MSTWAKSYEKQQFWRGFWVKMSYGIIDIAAFFVGMKYHLSLEAHMKMNLALMGVGLVGFMHGAHVWEKGKKFKDAAGRVEDKQQGSNPWFSSQASLAAQMDEYFAEAIQHIQAEEPGVTPAPIPGSSPAPSPSSEPSAAPSSEPGLLGSAA